MLQAVFRNCMNIGFVKNKVRCHGTNCNRVLGDILGTELDSIVYLRNVREGTYYPSMWYRQKLVRSNGMAPQTIFMRFFDGVDPEFRVREYERTHRVNGRNRLILVTEYYEKNEFMLIEHLRDERSVIFSDGIVTPFKICENVVRSSVQPPLFSSMMASVSNSPNISGVQENTVAVNLASNSRELDSGELILSETVGENIGQIATEEVVSNLTSNSPNISSVQENAGVVTPVSNFLDMDSGELFLSAAVGENSGQTATEEVVSVLLGETTVQHFDHDYIIPPGEPSSEVFSAVHEVDEIIGILGNDNLSGQDVLNDLDENPITLDEIDEFLRSSGYDFASN